jgi:hypothetical protein
VKYKNCPSQHKNIPAEPVERSVIEEVWLVIGPFCSSYGMQKGVSTSEYTSNVSEKTQELFGFIGKDCGIKNLNDVSFPIDKGSFWKQLQDLDEEKIEVILANTDLTDSALGKLESKDHGCSTRIEACEKAFFGNETLYKEFSAIKGCIADGSHSSLQKERLNWLILNHRGDYQCAKMLVMFYGSIKESTMYTFWLTVASFFKLPIRKH